MAALLNPRITDATVKSVNRIYENNDAVLEIEMETVFKIDDIEKSARVFLMASVDGEGDISVAKRLLAEHLLKEIWSKEFADRLLEAQLRLNE